MNTHQKILAMMSGCDSSKPMSFETLVEKSGLQPSTMESVLWQMRYASPPLINSATVTRDGESQEVYWPIGIVDHRKAFQTTINLGNSIASGFSGQRQPPRRSETERPAGSSGSEKKTTSTAAPESPMEAKPITIQEAPMNSTTKPAVRKASKITQAIYDKIVAHPGIKHADLIKHALKECPDSTEKQANKSIQNLIHVSKKIRAEGKGEDRTLHLTIGVSAVKTKPTAPAKRAVGKLITGKEAKALRKTKFRSSPKKASIAEVDRSFGCLIDDEDHLHLILGENKMILNPIHVQRLDGFLKRIGSRA